ncbi:hypothetical protein POJ06DRAFT_246151 [Lipomyces tetrasporus]|uniref:Transcriptional adapter 2 n=1 Tax=Lipomyces tetrasporus TaxID=54092 RepID=A0AAD7VUB4_9ASCO|nr:uncharacterized protein POJ06DRAFT_246151 [Lipomyces tetrasporus]KAJ8102952.1 hypothetical protein POJ06DRAFT_246151 [Lipomyces tetrasporus]
MTVIHRKLTTADHVKAAEPGVKFHCDVCSCDCTHLVRVRCAVCQDYDLCVPCFASGASSGTHKPYHDYSIVEQHAYPIFVEDWGADEELLLVEGAETLGLGNWQDIADHIGGRSKEEVDQHYLDVYAKSESYPIPNMKRKFEITPAEFVARKKARLDARRAQQTAMPLPKQKPTASVPSCHEVQGYMPGRLEFETEYENEAELAVKDMVFDPDDGEGEVELKLTVLDIYYSRLTSRAERKRVILEHGLLEYRKVVTNEKKRTREERELLNKTKPFARLMVKDDYADFSECLLEEHQIRKRIAELQEFRQNGIQTFEMATKYERDKAQRTLIARNTVGLGSLVPTSGSRYGSATPTSGRQRDSSVTAGTDVNNKTFRKPVANPLDISHAADLDLLSPAEQALCSQLRILPKPYLVIKETLFRELLRTGGILKKRTARELIKIDVNKTARIYEFFQNQRWLS